jgi:molybdate transport system substrate-binding protein
MILPLLRLLALASTSLLTPGAHAEGALTVAAATSLGAALREIGPLFQAAHPATRVRLSFGASGALLAQLAKGAPVDVLVSADTETLDRAQAQGLVAAQTRRTVARNALVVVVPVASTRTLRSLPDLLRPDIARVAIGLPASVPAGRYARQALQAAGLWHAMEPRMVGAHHARQALDYVARGEVDAGFVYATDAAAMANRVRVAFTVETPHPVAYPAAALAASPRPAEAARFVEYLLSPAAQAVLARHGFGRP